jgi:hypothetical protein
MIDQPIWEGAVFIVGPSSEITEGIISVIDIILSTLTVESLGPCSIIKGLFVSIVSVLNDWA